MLITGLLVFLMAFSAGCGNSEPDNSSSDSSGNDLAEQEQALEDAQREITEAMQEAEDANEAAEAAREEAEEASQVDEQTNDAPSSEESVELSPSETLDLQYQFLNSGQYDKAYDLFAEQSQRLISLEEYNSSFASSYEVSEYLANSEQIDGDTAAVQADLVVTGTRQGTQQYPVTQEFVLVDAEWQVIMRDAQVETFSEDQESEQETPSEEQIAPDCSLGEECDLGTSTITVTNAEQTRLISGVGETFEGNFVVVEYDYTYGGDSPTDAGEPPFQLSDEGGSTYSVDFEATSSYGIENDRSLIYETVQPGVASQGSAVFEVSPEASGFTLQVSDLISPQTGEAEIPLNV